MSASFTIFGGTATPGLDYTVLGNVIIPAGGTNATITIFPINDGTREGDETIRLRLTDVAGATPRRTETTVIILDDDGAPRFVSSQVSSGQFRAVIRGRAMQVFEVQSTTNLNPTAWTSFRTLTNSAAGSAEFSAPVSASPQAFRLMVP